MIACVYAELVWASDLGTTGLIDTPTARMRPDGELSLSISSQGSVDIYSMNFQATPWLETCLLYTSPSPRDQRGSRMPSSA